MSSILEPASVVGGIAIGTGVGAAVGDVVVPKLQSFKNDQWAAHPDKPLSPGDAIEAVFRGYWTRGRAEQEAGYSGFGPDRFSALYAALEQAPGIGLAFQAWRRRFLSDGDFLKVLQEQHIAPEWHSALTQLHDDVLSPQAIAYAIVRGLVDDQGILPVPPPTTPGKVPSFPRYGLNAVTEAQASGYTKERLSVLVGSSGRPMSPEAAALATFKGIIEHSDYGRAVGEGDVRNEWADAIFENSRFVLSPQDAAGLRLRGWKTKTEAEAIGALHGASPETMENLFLNRGRPAAPGQMANAAVRGINGPDGRPMDEAQFLKGIAESDIRPEWGPMLWQSRFLYPSLFQLTRLVNSGAISVAIGVEWARKARYAPEVVTALEASWSTPSGPAEAKWASTARRRLYTVCHNEYLDGSIDAARARGILELVGATADEINNILGLWDAENEITRLELTPAQIKKAYKKGLWTHDQAIEGLLDKQMTPEDAETFLAE